MSLDPYGNWTPTLPDGPALEDFSAGGPNAPACANTSGAASPVGSVVPSCLNQFYRWNDAYGAGQHALFQSTGLTSADWVQWI